LLKKENNVSQSYQKVVKKFSKKVPKVVKKLSKSCQKIVKKLSKSSQKVLKTLSRPRTILAQHRQNNRTNSQNQNSETRKLGKFERMVRRRRMDEEWHRLIMMNARHP
jgi:uncharacterized membrane-anchored protein YhcB (DUF1043 family)